MPIKVGFVGLSAAGWARVLEPALRSLGDTYQIVAVSTTNEKSAQESARRLSEETKRTVKAYYGDTSQIANDPDVEFVVVAVKAPEHKKALMPIIQAKKSFFIEWPAGKNLEETRELAKAARLHGVRTIVGLQGRQSPVLNKAKDLISQGKIGKLLSCSVIATVNQELYTWGPFVKQSVAYTADSSSGASMLDVAVGHHLDCLLHVLGTEFISVTATTATMYPTVVLTQADGTPTGETVVAQSPDHVAFSGILANGAIVSVSYRGGYKSTPGRNQLIWEIDGELGSIRLANDGPGGGFVHIRPPSLYLNGEPEEVKIETNNYLSNELATQFWEFAKGEEGRYATLDDAVKMRRLLGAVARSGQLGRKIDIGRD